MKRPYTKRNCDYWGHDVRYVHTAKDSDTGATVAYYGPCKRCSTNVFLPADGNKLNNAALTHLTHITFEDLSCVGILDKLPDYGVARLWRKK